MRTMGFWSRSLSGSLALWFGLVMAAPAVLHGCPRALAAASARDAHEMGATHEHNLPADHDRGGEKGCQCLGTCAVTATAVLTPAATVPAAVLVPVFAGAAPSPSPAVSRVLPDHSQPFATAPPLRTA